VNIVLDRWGMMKLKTQPTMISVLVKDQEEALSFYTEKLGLEKRLDVSFGPGLRLLTVAPKGQKRPEIALAMPDARLHGEERVRELMEHASKSDPWVFRTENCVKTYETLCARGIVFVNEPTKQFYGIEAIFADPYGNTFMLLEASPEARAIVDGRSIGSAA
jgi:uncharacterized glyoxalase superfamily protein PhnB